MTFIPGFDNRMIVRIDDKLAIFIFDADTGHTGLALIHHNVKRLILDFIWKIIVGNGFHVDGFAFFS